MTAPQKSECPVAAGQVAGQSKQDAAIIAGTEAARKAFENVRAAAAFKGYTLARTNPADGPVAYYATRWGLIRELRDLAAVAEFLTQIGGAA